MQVLTGESWAEAIARPLIFGYEVAWFPAFFFVTFLLLMQIVLVNVVVAVLLDKFVADPSGDEEDDKDGDAEDEPGDDNDEEDQTDAARVDVKPYEIAPEGVKPKLPATAGSDDKSAPEVESKKKAPLPISSVPTRKVAANTPLEKEIVRTQANMTALHSKLDLIMKALEVIDKFSGSTGSTETTVAPDSPLPQPQPSPPASAQPGSLPPPAAAIAAL